MYCNKMLQEVISDKKYLNNCFLFWAFFFKYLFICWKKSLINSLLYHKIATKVCFIKARGGFILHVSVLHIILEVWLSHKSQAMPPSFISDAVLKPSCCSVTLSSLCMPLQCIEYVPNETHQVQPSAHANTTGKPLFLSLKANLLPDHCFLVCVKTELKRNKISPSYHHLMFSKLAQS